MDADHPGNGVLIPCRFTLLPDPDRQSETKGPSKQSAVIAMLQRPEGQPRKSPAPWGWQRHTVRGLFSGTLKKKLGFVLASAKEERGRV